VPGEQAAGPASRRTGGGVAATDVAVVVMVIVAIAVAALWTL
jgi:hypothetical protein